MFAILAALWFALASAFVKPPDTVPPPPSAVVAVALAGEQIGKRYVYGAEGPDTFDCSGLIQFVYREAGIDLPRTTYKQWNQLPHHPIAEIQPGDLILRSDLGHVWLYVGDGIVVHAPGTGYKVQTAPMPVRGIRDEIVRPSEA